MTPPRPNRNVRLDPGHHADDNRCRGMLSATGTGTTYLPVRQLAAQHYPAQFNARAECADPSGRPFGLPVDGGGQGGKPATPSQGERNTTHM